MENVTIFFGKLSAINATTLKVTFNGTVTDYSNATFSIKRGTTSIVLPATWNAEKTEATFVSSTNLVKGDYTVTVSGIELADGNHTVSTTVEAQKIGKIEFVGNTLAKTADDKGTIGFKVYDQYGTDITGTANSLINAITWTSSVATDSLNDTNGVLTLDATANFVKDQTFVITAVDPATGVNKAVSVNIGESSSVNTLSLGEVKLPTNKTRIYSGSATAATIDLTAKDQYGNALDTAAKISGVTLLSSDAAVVPTITDVDAKAVININTAALASAKSVTITAVLNATGQTVTKTLSIVEPSKADTISIGQSETNTIAVNDAAGKIVFPITVTNQFGEELTAKEIAEQKIAGNLTVTSTGALTTATMDVDTTVGSKTYGKLINTAANTDAKGVGTIVVTTATGKTASVNVTTTDARKIVEIAAPTTVIANLVSGATSTFEYKYKDQYGDIVTPSAANRNSDLTWKFTVTDLTGDAGVISVNKTTGVDEDGIGEVTVSATAGKAGTAKVIAQLLNASDEVVSQVETTFSVIANNASGLTYSIKNIPTLFADATSAQAVDGTDVDARAIVIEATDGTNTYAVPNSQIIGISSVNGAVIASAAKLGDVAFDAQDNNWVVGAADSDDINFATGSDTYTDTVRVTVNTADGLKVLEKQVTVSKTAKRTQELKVIDTALVAANPYAIPTDAKEMTTFSFADRTAAETGTTAYLVAKDQYGVWTTLTKEGTNVILNNTAYATSNVDADNGFEFAAGKFILDEATSAQENASIRFKAGTDLRYSIVDGGATIQVIVKVDAEEAPTAIAYTGSTAGTANAGKIAAGETAIFVFDEELSTASKVALDTVFKTKFNAVKGASWLAVQNGTNGGYAWSVAGGKSVLTITASGDVTADTIAIPTAFTINKTDVVDVIGNAAGTTGTITVTTPSVN